MGCCGAENGGRGLWLPHWRDGFYPETASRPNELGAPHPMSYETFQSAIGETALLEVAAHWHAARQGRAMPAWQDIDPVALGRNLPIVWAWRYDFVLDTFVGRLAGEDIIAILGSNIRNRRIETCFRPDAVPIVRKRYKTVIDGPCFMHSHGRVFLRSGGNGHGERIVLPLAVDGVHSDGVLGATVYHVGVAPQRGDTAIDHHNEIVAYYPLTR